MHNKSSGKFSVRLANMQDADSVTAVLQAAFPILAAGHYDAEVLRLALPLICQANPKLLRSGTYYVAVDARGLVVGCGGWTHERPGTDTREPQVGHMRHFATDAGWVGRGVGRMIYQNSEAQAQEHGLKQLEAYAGLNAIGFYRSLGFKEIGAMSYSLAPGADYPSVHMSRLI